MDPGFPVTNVYPRRNANILSKLVFGWMTPYFYHGAKRGIDPNDLFKTANTDNSQDIGDKLQANWEKQLAKAKRTGKKPSLLIAIINTFLCNYMIYGGILFFQAIILRIFQPQVLGFLLRLFTDASSDIENPEVTKYLTGLVLTIVVLINAFITHHTMFGQQLVGMRARVAVSTLVYRKMLKLSKRSLGETAAGKVVNLLANDVNRFDFVVMALHYFWLAPIQVFIVAYFIWNLVGISALAGLITIVLFTLPVQVSMGRFAAKFRRKIAVRTDFRVKRMNEIISAIQVIKMYAWEKPFEKLISIARLNELKMIRKANYIRAVFLSSMVFIERTTLFLTLITLVLTGNPLTSDITYTVSPYFNLLQMSLAIFLPIAIQMSSECLVSIRRLQEFLELDEVQKSNIVKSDDKSINVKHVNAKWSEESGILTDVNFTVPAGKLCAIIGPVGSGKSSVLQLLLGELATAAGEIKLGGKISYAAQEPWLFGSSVRGNILFGQEYNKHLYNDVVSVCALEKDFKQFPYGDATLVGEKGVSLSGGQRARINLARAVYRQADVYLLDDPLSAVDTHVGKHLFEECIMNYLGSKTRILVTHQLQYLKKADIIVVLNNGKIEAQGTFAELSKSNTDFTKMLIAADETIEKSGEVVAKGKRFPRSRKESAASTTSVESDDQEKPKRIEEEVIIPSKSVLWDYIGAAGNICVILFLGSIMLTTQIASSVTDYFVSWWTEREENKYFDSISNDSRSLHTLFLDVDNDVFHTAKAVFEPASNSSETSHYFLKVLSNSFADKTSIYVYSGLIIALVVLTIMRSYLFFRCASNASKNMHAKMFSCLLKTPMRFFDTNPSGRILNRFSKDTGSMDEAMPRILSEAIQITMTIVGSVILICIANYWMIIPIVIISTIFYFLRKWYMLTAKSIKHVEGIAKSPVFSLLNSTLNGISTIRSFEYQKDLIYEFDGHQNVHTSAWILSIACMSSFGLWLDIFCGIFVAIISFSFVILSESDTVSGAIAGMAISQSLSLSGMLQHGMRQTAEVVNQLTSVERIMTYTKLEKEETLDPSKGENVPVEWPEKGKITFRNATLRYCAEDEPVLKNLEIRITAGEKIGIVGRTGAGKTSLISALFRLAPLEGTIIIDDFDTQQITLYDLRSRISIIPQEPVLFSAPLRYNLDPFNEFGDQDLWAALSEVELKEVVPSLDYKVAEGGSNFSVGQRQLICLARAIVRNNRILVLDEATANVDPRTDGLIQETIRKKFKDCTVLTIAHRLNTIMDSDKVLVMDAGHVAEFDHPHILLQIFDGHFTKLVRETGPSMEATLRDIAKKCHEARDYDNSNVIEKTAL